METVNLSEELTCPNAPGKAHKTRANLRRAVTLRNRLLAAVLWLICIGTGNAANTRVAIVASDQGTEVENVLSLAQAKLGADAGIELLEREAIGRVLDEQKLSLAGVADAGRVVAAGKLLPVDVFAVVESQTGGGKELGLVIFDARTGVKYWDAALPAGVVPAADAVAAAVHSAAGKQQRLGRGVRTIGLLTVRNADLPRSQDGLCESIGLLLERGLPRSPDVAVLERKRLEHVNEERALPGSPADLTASLVTVELEISRAADGLQATALLTEAGNDHPRKITAQSAKPDAALLAEALLEKLIEALHAAPVAAGCDALLEASRFDREAAHHFKHSSWSAAVRAQEAASALAPANFKYQGRLTLSLIRLANDYLFTPAGFDPATLEKLLNVASRGVNLSAEMFRRNSRFNDWLESGHDSTFDEWLRRLCERLRDLRKESRPEMQQKIDAFFSLCRSRSLDYLETVAGQAEADPKYLDHYWGALHSESETIRTFYLDSAHYTETMYQITDRWLAVSRNWQPKFNHGSGGHIWRRLFGRIVNEEGEWPWPSDDSEYLKKMSPLFLRMQQHNNPVVRLYGVFGEIRAGMRLGKISDQEGEARFATQYRTLAQEIITAPEPWNAVLIRENTYAAWGSAIRRLPLKKPRAFLKREHLELFNFMMSRHEIIADVVSGALRQLENDQPSAALALARRVSASLNLPEFSNPDKNTESFRSMLKEDERDILLAHPELGLANPEVPWIKARKLFDGPRFHGLRKVISYFVANDIV